MKPKRMSKNTRNLFKDDGTETDRGIYEFIDELQDLTTRKKTL
jgi:hypothetical protein